MTRYDIQDQILNDTFNGVIFTFEDGGGTGIDLTGASIYCDFRYRSKTGEIVKSLETGTGITINDAVNGVMQIDPFIIDWCVDTYWYDIQIDFPSGVIKTYVGGTMKVLQDVTTP